MTEEKENNKYLGLIVHYGLYSIPAFDDIKSASKRKIINGSEWYKKRLEEDPEAFRPTSGAKATKEYHKKHYPDMVYDDFSKMFKHDLKNIDKWTKLAKKMGASYIILTAKHHDGFCLWPSKVGRHSKKDVVQAFKDSCEKRGLIFGLYYSWYEFDKSCTKEYLSEVVKPQIKELIKYNPQIWWFDGSWCLKSQYSLATVEELCSKIRKKIPTAIINDRLGIKYTSDDMLGFADYRVYGDRTIPEKKPEVAWEHINTVGLSWGRNKQQKDKDYKTIEELKDLYINVRKLGGKFLINIGPDADGILDPIEESRLLGLGEVIKELKEEDITPEKEIPIKEEELSTEVEEQRKNIKYKTVKDFRVYAFNPNGIRSLMNKGNELRNFLRDQIPDVLFFPETKGNAKIEEKTSNDLEAIFEEALPDSQYNFYWSYSEVPGRFGNCLAISNKYKVEEIRYGWSKEEIDPEGRIIIIKVKRVSLVQDKGLYIMGLYVPNASSELKRLQYKLSWMKKLRKTMDKLKARGNSIIVIGDINVAPTEHDLANPRGNERTPGFTIEERQQFKLLLGEEYVDVWRERNPIGEDELGYTYWNTKFNARIKNTGWRIDLVIMDKDSYDLGVVKDMREYPKYLGSDHCPIGVSLSSKIKKKIVIKKDNHSPVKQDSVLSKKYSAISKSKESSNYDTE